MLITSAQKRSMVRSFAAVGGFVVTFFVTLRYVGQHHPMGVALYLCAALPWVMMCGVIVSVALYFREERDGYSREVAMRNMLWGAGAMLAVNLFLAFLHAYGWKGQPPVNLELWAFGGATQIAALANAIKNRPER